MDKYEETMKNLYPQGASLGHKIPLIKGGTSDEKNLVACCIRCNIEKGQKYVGRKKYKKTNNR